MPPATPLSFPFGQSRHPPTHCLIFSLFSIVIVVFTALEGVCSGQKEEVEGYPRLDKASQGPSTPCLLFSCFLHLPSWHRNEVVHGTLNFFFLSLYECRRRRRWWRALAERGVLFSVADRLALRFRRCGYGARNAMAGACGGGVLLFSSWTTRTWIRASPVVGEEVACRGSTGTWTSQHKVSLMQAFTHLSSPEGKRRHSAALSTTAYQCLGKNSSYVFCFFFFKRAVACLVLQSENCCLLAGLAPTSRTLHFG